MTRKRMTSTSRLCISTLGMLAVSALGQAQLTAVMTQISSTGDAFILSPATFPSTTTVAYYYCQAVINRDDNVPSMSKKGAPIVTVRGVRPLGASGRPTSGYIIVHQVAHTHNESGLYNNGAGSSKSHSYDCGTGISSLRPSSPDTSFPYPVDMTGNQYNLRKKVTSLTWTPNLNLGFDDYEWTQTFSLTLPHTLSASAKVSGPRSGKDGNSALGTAEVTLWPEFAVTLPVATVSLTLTGVSLNGRSILCDVTTIADGTTEHLAPDTDGGITLLPLASTSGTRKILVWVAGSLKKATYASLSDGSSVACSVTPVFGDINGDNVIDSADTSLMNERITNASGTAFMPDEYYDFNQDGVIDSSDLAILTGNLTQIGD